MSNLPDPNSAEPQLPSEKSQPLSTRLEEVVQKTEEEAILLFDEADSLFTKRSDVKDDHDRYTKD